MSRTLTRTMSPWFHHLTGIFDERRGHGGNVDETVVVDPDVDERAESGDVGDDTLEDHPGHEVVQPVRHPP